MRHGIKIYVSLFLICIIHYQGQSQLSPGELVQAHAYLEGMSNCTKCHILGSKISNDKCLSCHVEIKTRVDKKKGYHSSAKVYKKSCTICHSDHHGRNYKIIRFTTESFDHNTTGYRLEGKHATAKCADCHQKAYVVDPLVKKKKSTYLGLGIQCLTCHEDYHRNTLSVDCFSCHNYSSFSPAQKFDHSKSKFPLKGKHSEVKCEDCHPVNIVEGKEFIQFKGIRFNNCSNCHIDVHKGQFGAKCSDCHTEQSFRIIKDSKGFNHDLTGFTLEGKHNTIDCRSCHKTSLTAPLKHINCNDCHTDFHESEFTSKKPASDCRDCHTPYGFESSSFDLQRHNESPFALEGAHTAVKCESCHKKSGKWRFRQIGFKCNECHPDIHKDQLSPKYYPDANCRSCHSPESWREIVFNHDVTNFPLKGKHADQNCRQCHLKVIGDAEMGSAKDIGFTGLNSECMNCHHDAHEGQFVEGDKTDCSKCHTPDNWIKTIFDHNNARFKLDGRHMNIACNNCHPIKEGTTRQYILYKTGKLKCADCH